MLLINHPMLSFLQITGRGNSCYFLVYAPKAEAFCGKGMDPGCFSLVFSGRT
jgi:hypothetical protein